MKIAIIGYGGVGRAFTLLLNNKKADLLKIGLDLQVNYIIGRVGGVYSKEGIQIEDLMEFTKNNKDFTDYPNGGSKSLNFDDIIKNKDIDLVVETTPTNLVDGEPANNHIHKSLEAGFHVVTGNKGPLLFNYRKLKDLAIKNKVQLGIGCTTGGALPSINAGIFDLAGSRIEKIEGVLNGTTNFIIKTMESQQIEYKEALRMAQEQGIAESNPSLDVEGLDTATKILILTNVLLDKDYKLEDTTIEGITNLKVSDINKALDEGKKYKLIGRAIRKNDEMLISVQPEKVSAESPFYYVDGKNKGLSFTSDTLGDLFIMGGASGVIPAAASILRDIINIHKGNKVT